MGMQLSLLSATSEPLEELAGDKREAKAEFRAALDRLATKHGASARDLNHAIEDYADDTINDALFEVERELNSEADRS
jgi:hypothetical protein